MDGTSGRMPMTLLRGRDVDTVVESLVGNGCLCCCPGQRERWGGECICGMVGGSLGVYQWLMLYWCIF